MMNAHDSASDLPPSSRCPHLLVLELGPPDSRVLGALRHSERDVADQVILGRSNAEIARARSASSRTVANQVASIFGAVGVQSRAELVRRAFGGEISR